jgi:hypothetical protein
VSQPSDMFPFPWNQFSCITASDALPAVQNLLLWLSLSFELPLVFPPQIEEAQKPSLRTHSLHHTSPHTNPPQSPCTRMGAGSPILNEFRNGVGLGAPSVCNARVGTATIGESGGGDEGGDGTCLKSLASGM